MHSMTIYTARCRQNAKNTEYPDRVQVDSLATLLKTVTKDNLMSAMKDNRRSEANFIKTDCIYLDLDNTHSENPDTWKTLDDIADALPDVEFYYVQSRNYMKPKAKTDKAGNTTIYAAREKYHIYFPLQSEIATYKEATSLMMYICGLFPYFDMSAAKPAQFFYGVENPKGGEYDGQQTIDEYIKAAGESLKQQIETNIAEYGENLKSGNYAGGETQKAFNKLCDFFGIRTQATITADIEAPQNGETAGDNWLDAMEQEKSIKWFLQWAADHGQEIRTAYNMDSLTHPKARVFSVYCPWESEHTETAATDGTDTVVIIDRTAKLHYLCRHGHCLGRSWKEYRQQIEQKNPIIDSAIDAGWKEHAQIAPASPQNDFNEQGRDNSTAATKSPTEGADSLQGLLTYDDAVNIFESADDRYIELKSFPQFSATAKIKLHDSVVIAADTGAGKSSLALNFLNDLNEKYPCIYINLEMDAITVLRRLTAIYSGMELDRIEGYKHDEKTAAAVNTTLTAITARQPLQIIQEAYNLQQIEAIIKQSTKGRTAPTIVIIDHSLLVDTQEHSASRYDRFTQVSEGLRKMALKNNIILFVLLQQNRAGKAIDDERPKNSSLKESGSWENDASQICFLWYDPTSAKKKLLLTKNRNGSGGEFTLNYWKKTQTYTEETASADNTRTTTAAMPNRQTKRERQKQKLLNAYETALFRTAGKPTLQAIAEAADVTTSTIKTWLKEYGGFMVDGQPIDPAGIDAVVEQQEFIKLTPADEAELPEKFRESNFVDLSDDMI